VLKNPLPKSPRRKPGFSKSYKTWIPAFAGMPRKALLAFFQQAVKNFYFPADDYSGLAAVNAQWERSFHASS
jgi:hypothetical protein